MIQYTIRQTVIVEIKVNARNTDEAIARAFGVGGDTYIWEELERKIEVIPLGFAVED